MTGLSQRLTREAFDANHDAGFEKHAPFSPSGRNQRRLPRILLAPRSATICKEPSLEYPVRLSGNPDPPACIYRPTGSTNHELHSCLSAADASEYAPSW